MERLRSGRLLRQSILSHHLYELRRGLRQLVLFTTDVAQRGAVVEKLEHDGIPWMVQPTAPGSSRINIFFGQEVCLEVLRAFRSTSLADLSAEQDFILGVMLGYDRHQQCERYLKRLGRQRPERDDPGAAETWRRSGGAPGPAVAAAGSRSRPPR